MLVIISGPSAVGKSFCIDFFCKNYDFSSMTPYTTRKPRKSEAEGVHYHFLKEEELRQKSKDFNLGYWTQPFGGDWYGYSHHVDELPDKPENWIIQATVDVAISIKKKFDSTIIIFLDYANDQEMEDRIRLRYGKNAESLKDRLTHAEKEKKSKNKFDHIIESSDPEETINKLADYIFKNVVKTPSLNTVPGPLSDIDIKKSTERENGIKLIGFSNPIEKYLDGWSVDFTLANKYYRIRKPIISWKKFNLLSSTKEDVHKRFIEKVCDKKHGIIIRQNEFILASTKEKIELPNNIVGFISGRSSYARIGISIELSQTILQPGHSDIIPLQIKNNLPYPIVIYPGTKIVQAVLFRTISNSSTSYAKKQNAKYRYLDTLRSQFHRDEEYEEIKLYIPKKLQVNWDPLLNMLLFCFSFFVLITILLENIAKGEYINALTYFRVAMILVLLLVLVIRGIRFFKNGNR